MNSPMEDYLAHLNNEKDRFGKTQAELKAVMGTLNQDAIDRIGDRVEESTKLMLMAYGFPRDGYSYAGCIRAVTNTVLADLITEGYLEVSEKGFVKIEDVEA